MSEILLQEDIIKWIQKHAMTNGQLMDMLDKNARNYVKDAQNSLSRNHHMNKLDPRVLVKQDIIDAVIVDFINYIASQHCMDYGMYTKDLQK